MNFEDVYKIGKIGKPHGVKGEVSLLFDDDVFDRTGAEYLVLDIDGILVPFFMDEYRFHGSQTALVKFCDVDTQDDARALTGCSVYFPRSLAEEDGGPMSWAQITGFTLADADTGNDIGTVSGVDDSTANLLLEVTTPGGGSLLVPLHEELVGQVDAGARRLVMHLPQGLLDL